MRTRRKNCSESCQLRKPPNGIWYPAMVANCIIQITETRYDDDDYRPAPEQQQQNSTVVDGGGGGFKNVLSKFCLSCPCFGFRCLTFLCRCVLCHIVCSYLNCGLGWTGLGDLLNSRRWQSGNCEEAADGESFMSCPMIEFN